MAVLINTLRTAQDAGQVRWGHPEAASLLSGAGDVVLRSTSASCVAALAAPRVHQRRESGGRR